MKNKAKPGQIYSEVYRHSIEDPEAFWGEAAEQLHWYRKWDRVLDVSRSPFHRWFVGGKTNLCYNCVDRHVLGGSEDKPAIFWESAARGESRTITYGELYWKVNRFAGVLKNLGVQKGDRVAIYLPLVPEAFIAMLACARIGAIHVVIFAGYGIDALTRRIKSARPRVVITADGSLRRNKEIPLKDIVDKSLERVPVETIIVLDRGIVKNQMKEGRDYYWADLVREKGEQYVEPLQLESTNPSYILYTAGSTGEPVGVVRDTGGYMVALYNSMKQIFNASKSDVFWTTSDIGWVVGHSYVVYAPLLLGITSVMFEGTPDYPDHGVWWRVVEKYGVSILYSSPTAMKMLRRFGVEHIRKCDISTLRYLFLVGEILDENTWRWASGALSDIPVVDTYWTTESGWPMVAYMPGVELLPMKPGSPGRPVVGHNLSIIDKEGKSVPVNKKGYLVAKPPLPPGHLVTLWEDDERYRGEYWQQFPGEMLLTTGDYARADEGGYLTILGRTDNVLNVAAHRIGTREIEEVVLSHPAVAEVSVVGVDSAIKGEEPVCFVVLKRGFKPSGKVGVEIKRLVRERIGAVASPKEIRLLPKLPKTSSGRYMSGLLKALYAGRSLEELSAVEDEASADEVKKAIAEMKQFLS